MNREGQTPDDGATGVSADSLVCGLRARFEEALAHHLPHPVEVAVIGFPNHPNVGDSAIWLGERIWLKTAGHRMVYVADLETYSRRALARTLGAGTVILLHGGGNFGDLWPEHQVLRERVMHEFPDRKIIQLPQTVHFRDPVAVERARQAAAMCSDLVIMARDRTSLDRVKTLFGDVRSDLVPDAALAIGRMDRVRPPTEDALWLVRTDSEAIRPMATSYRVPSVDWLVDDGDVLRGVSVARMRSEVTRWGRGMRRIPPATGLTQRLLMPCFDRLAQRRVADGLSLLSGARFVVTDRLHAHILCLLLGIPHVVVDTGYGKIRSFHETWTSGWRMGRLTEEPDEVPSLLAQLAADES